jgi:hypothetical protein
MCFNASRFERRQERRRNKRFLKKDAQNEAADTEQMLDLFAGDDVAKEVIETAPLIRSKEEEASRARWFSENPYALSPA